MYQPLPLFPPLFPPGKWWRLFLAYVLGGESFEKGIARANKGSGIKSRDWMRISLTPQSRISVPVSGGASTLKNYPPESWTLSGEAAATARTMGATLATLYGRRPFFPAIESWESVIPAPVPADFSARSVCTDAFRKCAALLGLYDVSLIQTMEDTIKSGNGRIRAVCSDFERYFNPDLSILDLLATLGPDAIFPLLPPF